MGVDAYASIYFVYSICFYLITKTRLFKYIENYTTEKRKIFRKKKSDIFHISAQNIDLGTR